MDDKKINISLIGRAMAGFFNLAIFVVFVIASCDTKKTIDSIPPLLAIESWR